jgi:hypothetical protein
MEVQGQEEDGAGTGMEISSEPVSTTPSSGVKPRHLQYDEDDQEVVEEVRAPRSSAKAASRQKHQRRYRSSASASQDEG